MDFREGRREGFVDWLTAPDNPLFARVAVNRIWAWHFGEGMQRVTSDFGVLGGTPSNQKLLDYLASEFVAHNYSMKWLHRLIVTSHTYQLCLEASSSSWLHDTQSRCARRYIPVAFPPAAAGSRADLGRDSCSCGRSGSFGGRQVVPASEMPRRERPNGTIGRREAGGRRHTRNSNRRGIYIMRGYIPSTDVMPNFLLSFDVDDGRDACPMRTQTVTAPQALFTMNDERDREGIGELRRAHAEGQRRRIFEGRGDARVARPPWPSLPLPEARLRADLCRERPGRMKDLAWLLFNLDEFMYVR